jgi:hypothetical protein
MIKTPQPQQGFVQQTRKTRNRNRTRPSQTPLALAPGDDIAFSSLELAIYSALKAAFGNKKELTPEQLVHALKKMGQECTLQHVWAALDNEEALGKYAYRKDKYYWTLRTQ